MSKPTLSILNLQVEPPPLAPPTPGPNTAPGTKPNTEPNGAASDHDTSHYDTSRQTGSGSAPDRATNGANSTSHFSDIHANGSASGGGSENGFGYEAPQDSGRGPISGNGPRRDLGPELKDSGPEHRDSPPEPAGPYRYTATQKSEMVELPYREIGGWPSLRGFVLSILAHVLVIAGLANFHFTLPPKPLPIDAALDPTQIRLNGKLYYVSSISGSEGAKKSDKVVAPLAAAAGKSARPRPNGGRSGQSPTRASLLPALPAPAAAPAPAPPAATPDQPKAQPAPEANRREQARTFVPPEIKRRPNATQTLIQPISPPDLVPPPTPLPSFRVMTPTLMPKIPKPFIAPGRKVPQPPAQVAQLQPLELDLIHADPAPSPVEPKLALPRTPPPPDPPKTKAPEGPTPAPVGEPINILSLSNRPVPPSDKVIVPQGNIAQESGESASSANGAGNKAAAGTGVAAAANGTGKNPNANGPSANGQGAGTQIAEGRIAGAGGNGEGGPGAGTGRGAGNGPGIGTAGAGTGAGAPGTGASGNGTGNEGKGNSTVGNGTGAALTGGGATGSTTAIVGGPGGSPNGTGTGNGTGVGAGAGGTGRTLPGQAIERSPGGNFDTVVVQSSPLDQYPESRGLLTGRPIYSVYVNAGGARDWTLYFCVPNEKPAVNDSPVVQLGPPATPVKAPYPFRMVRPAVTLPTWEKYVLIHGYVNAQGHFEGVRIVRSILPEIDKSLLASLAGWEFRAATRDGVPIMVEFLLSIPAKGL